MWSSHQRADDKLGPIYRYLASTSTEEVLKVPGALKARAQSYRLVNGVLNYRPIREIGQFDLDEGWVVAVPAALRTQVIKECHGDNCHGHGGAAKTVMAIRQRYHFRRIAKAVREFIRTCIPCRRAKTLLGKKDAPLMPMLSFHPFAAHCVPHAMDVVL